MSTRGQLEEVQREDGRTFNAWDIVEGSQEFFSISFRVEHDQRATALSMAASTHLPLARSQFAGFLNFDNVRTCPDCLEESNGRRCLDKRSAFEGLRGDDQGNFGDSRDAVAAGKKEGRDGRGGKGRRGCKAPRI